MTPARVVLADDHTMFREGMASVLTSRGDVEVVGQGPHGRDAVALVERHKPDVVIMQVEHHPRRAEEILSAMRSASPNSRIVVLTMFDNLHYVRTLSRLGIDAYVHKSSSVEELLATVSALSRNPEGDNVVVVSMPRGSLERIGDGHENALSDRELEVVVLVARGFSNRQVARELHISEATVKRHLANIYEKIGVGSRSDAVRTALAEQWIGFHEIVSADSDGHDDSGGLSL
jgi:DNA-binding NarL/FixJ family response regulator